MATNEVRVLQASEQGAERASEPTSSAQRLEVLLYELFTNAPLAIGIREVRGHEIIHLEDNPRAAALFGRSPEQMRGITDADLGVPPEQIDRAIARFRAARSSGHAIAAEITVPSADGAPRTLAGKVLALEDRRAERYAFMLEDVTELRALEAGIERAAQLATLGTLSAAIGHEIGNPTMYAQLHLRFALERAEALGLDPGVIRDVRTAQEGLEHIARVLRDMRTLTSDPIVASDVSDVGGALQTVIDLIRPALDSSVALHYVAPTVPAVRGTHGRLVQVLINLVRNAVESVESRGGNVWVDVTQPTADTVQIDIADDGPGIDETVRGRLFEAFASTKASGTGLGLYVSRMLITRAGGTIEALDRDGGGLRMRIVLPVAG